LSYIFDAGKKEKSVLIRVHPRPKKWSRMRIALATIGFASTVAQVLLMRELVATFYGNELLFGLVLAAWLAWVAAGAWGLARLIGHGANRQAEGRVACCVLRVPSESPSWVERGRGTFAAGLVLAAGLLPAQIMLVRGVRTLLGVTPGAFVEFGPMVGAVVVILAPLCLLVGVLFTLGARMTVERGGTAGQAYVWESIGAVTGGALFSFVFVRWLDPFQTALLVSAINLAVASGKLQIGKSANQQIGKSANPQIANRKSQPPFSILHSPSSILHSPFSVCLLLASCLLLLASFPLGHALHTATLRWQWADLAFAADSPYGRLTVQARDGQRAFFENGLLAFETQGTFPEEVAHFPLLLHPDPREVLLVGGGVAGDVREVLKHPNTRVAYVELDPLLIQAAQAHLPAEDAAVLNDPRVTLVLTDGRLYVKEAQHTFDVVILDLPEPATGALNRFYTREFFAEVRAILNPGGVFALGLPSAENYWSAELARLNGSVYHTLRAVFPQVVALPGEHIFFLASAKPLQAEPAVLASRLAERGVETHWVTPAYIEYVFTTDRFAETQAELAAMAGVRLNRDLAPVCYYYNMVLWLSRFYPSAGSRQVPVLRRAFENASLVNLWWVAVPLALAVLLVRWRRARRPEAYGGWAVPFAIAGIGLAEMMLEVVILFAFQVLHGTVYARVSLITAAFMGGLALGGAAGNRVAGRRALIAVQAGVAVYSGVFPLMLALPIPVPVLVFPLLALVAGVLTGMAFPVAVMLTLPPPPPCRGGRSDAGEPPVAQELPPPRRGGRGEGETGRVVGRLYGADLVGGCLGALLGAVLFVPVLGIPQTCAAIALVGLAGLLVLV
jgi:spermidine synthase